MDNPHQTVLVMGHPGHELLVHHWIERTHCLRVFALTDGSGSNGRARTANTKAVLASAGAQIGEPFARLSDRHWYEQILAGNLAPFEQAAHAIAAHLSEPSALLVCDAVEHFNPMHDLAAVVGYLSGRLASRRNQHISWATFPIEFARIDTPIADIRLDADAVSRKNLAIESYPALSAEVRRIRHSSPHIRIDRELLFTLDVPACFPPRLEAEPYYERFARQRGFVNIITYRDHVLPLARRLIAAADAL